MTTETYDWLTRHYIARQSPTTVEEERLVLLLDGIRDSIDCHLQLDSFPDGCASEAYGQAIEGFIELLNFGTGKLDAGTLWTEAALLAELACWDLDLSKIIWEP